jgi:excisionase family DNA binding protein
VHSVHVEDTRGEHEVSETKELMTPGEVADALRVDVKTVARWVHQGLLRAVKTPGGQNRMYAEDIRAIVNGETGDKSDVPASEYWRDKN